MLAIIIPYYKLTFFEATLQSLANQTDKSFKVYIGDDASPESPIDLLDKYNGKFDFVYHRFKSNLGGTSLTKQWDRCIALSDDEEWLMILGDDDVLEETVVESWYKNYSVFKKGSNVIRFATKIILEESKMITSSFKHPVWEDPTDSFVRIFKGQTRSSLSEYIFSRKAYIKYGFTDYPLAWCSDYKAMLEFSERKPIYTINESNVYFRISDINISGKKGDEFVKTNTNIQFFKDVVIDKIRFFKKKQRLELLMAYEVAIKKSRKPTLEEWLLIMKFYLMNFTFISFAKCIRRFFISVF